MRRIVSFGVASFLGAAATVQTAAAAGTDPAPLGFKGAQLGMSIETWRTLSPPSGAGPTAGPACSNEARIARIANNPLSAATDPGQTVACSYVSVFGNYVLPHSVEFDPRFRATGLRYLFRDGRLVEVRFEVSIDAFDDVIGWSKSRYGPMTDVFRDTLPTSRGQLTRVRDTWRTPAGDVVVTDPDEGLTTLSVRLIDRSTTSPQNAASTTRAG